MAKRLTPSKEPYPVCGCWLNLFNQSVAELIGRSGYSHAMIDMEHSACSLDSALPVIQAVQVGGAKAIVRVPDKQPQWIGRLMDMGADGVMVPMVNTPAEAETLASAAVYAPEGSRGMAAAIVRASHYGVELEDYLKNYRKNFTLMVQIESRQAVDAAEGITAVDGIDCIFLGPFDLSGSLGHMGQPDHKETRSAMRKVVKFAKAASKLTSTLPTPGNSAKKLLGQGYDLVFSGTDLGMLRAAMQADVSAQQSVMEKLRVKS